MCFLTKMYNKTLSDTISVIYFMIVIFGRVVTTELRWKFELGHLRLSVRSAQLEFDFFNSSSTFSNKIKIISQLKHVHRIFRRVQHVDCGFKTHYIFRGFTLVYRLDLTLITFGLQ